MSLVLNDSTDLTSLGDAIRAKTGDSGLMTVAEMATAVSGIEAGGSGEDNFDLASLTKTSSTASFGNTNGIVHGYRGFNFTINENFVCGFLIMAVRMQTSTSTSLTSNTTLYRTVYLITLNKPEDITSMNNVASYYRLSGYTYNDDPILVNIEAPLTGDLNKAQNGDFTGIRLDFSVGRSGDGVAGGTKYTYKFASAANDNIRFYQFCKPTS